MLKILVFAKMSIQDSEPGLCQLAMLYTLLTRHLVSFGRLNISSRPEPVTQGPLWLLWFLVAFGFVGCPGSPWVPVGCPWLLGPGPGCLVHTS